MTSGTQAKPETERILVLGWNKRTQGLLVELDRYVPPGSELLVIAEGANVETRVEAVGRKLQNLKLSYRADDTTDRGVLDAATAEGYEHVVVMSIVARGGLSTVMKLAGSSEPKNQAFQSRPAACAAIE